ncbi:MAG: ATP-binding protein, partial [Deinococcota bacterium]
AFDAARQFAENPRGWLVLIGAHGSGKTHLAAAIANFRAETHIPPQFRDVSDFLDHLRATFSPSSTVTLDRRFEEVRTAPLLILDNLGMQSSTPWATEKLYQLLNYRYIAKLPTVVTSALSLDEIEPRLRSRMMDRRLCSIYAITAPPYTGAPSRKTRPAGKSRRSR